ncbi:hypothetical protein BDW75DRAFT_237839 [Aspergillus navahoensis]
MAPTTEEPEPSYGPLGGARGLSQDDDRNSEAQEASSSMSTAHEIIDKRSAGLKISDWFILEVLATVISAGALITLVAVLATYDRKPQPNWHYMSLNSLISWLSTISKACILFFVSEALGQSKWVWFAQQERAIRNIRTFDSASRGPYGALELIWTLRGRHFAVVGSVAVVLALAIDPFAQNLVQYYEGKVTDGTRNATISSASYYGNYAGPFQTDAFLVEYALKTNVYNVFFSRDSETPRFIPQYGCSSTNCTWDLVVSLDAVALCANVTAHLTQSCDVISDEGASTASQLHNCTASLSKSQVNAWVTYGSSYSEYDQAVGFVVKAAGPSQAITYTNTTTTAIQFVEPQLVRETPERSRVRWEATECTIEPVIRSFRASVRDNEYSEETLDIWWNRTLVKMNYTGDADYLASYPDFAYTNDSDYQWQFYPPWPRELGQLKLPPNTAFNYTLLSEKALGKFLRAIFTGYYWKNTTDYGYTSTAPDAALYASNDILQSFHREGRVVCEVGCDLDPGRFNHTMSYVAQAISKTFRDSRDTTYGRLEVTVTQIRVRWQWIALPIVVWVLGAITLFGTVWKTRRWRAPRWKNDPLPLLFLYGHEEEQEPKEGLETSKGRWVPDIDTLKAKLHGH